MPWLVFTVLVWLVLLFTAGFKELGRLWSSCLWAILVGYFFNRFFISEGLYQFQETLITYNDIPLLYLAALGGLAVIIMRFLPEQKIWQLPYLILFSAGLTMLNFFALSKKYILSMQWSPADSFIFTLIAIITVVWLSSLTIKPQEKRYYIH